MTLPYAWILSGKNRKFSPSPREDKWNSKGPDGAGQLTLSSSEVSY